MYRTTYIAVTISSYAAVPSVFSAVYMRLICVWNGDLSITFVVELSFVLRSIQDGSSVSKSIP